MELKQATQKHHKQTTIILQQQKGVQTSANTIGDGTFGRPRNTFPLPDFEQHVCGRVLSAG